MRPRLVLILTVSQWGCTSPSGIDASLDGHFGLVAFGGVPVPVSLDEMPTSDGHPSGCFFTLSDGELTVDAGARAFYYAVHYRNSCTGALLSTSATDGSLTQSGGTLTFQIVGQDGPITFSGTVLGSIVIIERTPNYIYTFKKTS